MKSDLQQLMLENDIDAIFVTGAGYNNPAMVYMTGVMEFSEADLILQRGKPGVLFYHDIERDGAARTGYPIRSFSDFQYHRLLKEANGDGMLALAYRYRDQFASIGLTSGQVAVYGETDLGNGHYLLSKLEEMYPDLRFVTDPASDVLRIARATKDKEEIAPPDLARTMIKGYKTADKALEAVNFPQDCIETEESYNATRDALTQARLQAEQTKTAIEAAKAVPSLSKAVEKGSPADMVAEGMKQ